MLKYHALKVTEVRAEAQDAVCLAFAIPPELRDEYRFEAGQHIGLRLAVDGEELRRTYSIVSAPGDVELRIGVRVHPQGRMSRHIASRIRVGDSLDVLTPNGSFHTPLDPRNRKTYAAFAAGCGITPVLSIAKAVLAAQPHSRVLLFYGNREAARVMFLEELLALKDVHLSRLSVHFLFTREPQDVELFNGRIDGDKIRQLAGALFEPQGVDEYFLCGPGDMIDNVSAALAGLGVGAGRIHSERFSVAEQPAAAPIRPEKPAPGKTGVEVAVVMDGRRRTFSMPMGGETVLEAAERTGLDLPYSCRAGVCSTCRTKVVKGAVEMAQNYALEPWEVEAGFVLACQSTPTTHELELDYDQR
jgi:ring-1,2-phenylacetyl-CoA epoxidase subunit PaaE